jgi:RHH-type proline utilization regulon transcriptional repressor/proline dehydrogenase/delta 1-pyrroline-5-carboxylate dehydrogenase
LGPTPNDALEQAIMSLALGNSVIALLSEKDHSSLVGLGFAEKSIARIEKGPSSELLASDKYHAIFYFGDAMSVESELMNRQDIVPVIDSIFEPWRLVNERVVTIDTTASGGNANLLAL